MKDKVFAIIILIAMLVLGLMQIATQRRVVDDMLEAHDNINLVQSAIDNTCSKGIYMITDSNGDKYYRCEK